MSQHPRTLRDTATRLPSQKPSPRPETPEKPPPPAVGQGSPDSANPFKLGAKSSDDKAETPGKPVPGKSPTENAQKSNPRPRIQSQIKNHRARLKAARQNIRAGFARSRRPHAETLDLLRNHSAHGGRLSPAAATGGCCPTPCGHIENKPGFVVRRVRTRALQICNSARGLFKGGQRNTWLTAPDVMVVADTGRCCAVDAGLSAERGSAGGGNVRM